MYIYLYIDVAMTLMAIVQILRLTLMIYVDDYRKMQKTLVHLSRKEVKLVPSH